MDVQESDVMRKIIFSAWLVALLVLLAFGQDRVARRPLYPTGGFVPSDIAGLVLWLKADAITGLADGDSVVTWPDSSGNGNDMSSLDAGRRPVYKTAVLNGLPVVRFDATNDQESGAASASLPFTAFIVYSYRSTTSAARRALTGSTNWLLGPYNNSHQMFNGAFMGSPPSVTQNVFVLSEALQASGAADFYINAAFVNSNTNNNAPGTIHLAASGFTSEPLDGDVAEVIVYNTKLGSTDRQNVETYINAKWAVY